MAVPSRLCFLLLLLPLLLLAGCWVDAADSAAEDTSTGSEKTTLFGLMVNQAVQLQQLSSQMLGLSERLDRLQQISLRQQGISEQHTNQLQDQTSQLQEQSDQVKSVRSQMNLMKGVQEDNSASIVAFNSSSKPKQVAFTVTYTKHVHAPLNVGYHGTLKFHVIVTNIANGYDPLSGHFTAPYSGLYAFYGSLRRRDDKHGVIKLAIHKENHALVHFISEGSGDPWEFGAAFTTTHLEKGQDVYVRHESGGTFLEDGDFTTFSGMLIAAD